VYIYSDIISKSYDETLLFLLLPHLPLYFSFYFSFSSFLTAIFLLLKSNTHLCRYTAYTYTTVVNTNTYETPYPTNTLSVNEEWLRMRYARDDRREEQKRKDPTPTMTHCLDSEGRSGRDTSGAEAMAWSICLRSISDRCSLFLACSAEIAGRKRTWTMPGRAIFLPKDTGRGGE
jgi:hypothetical protein